MEACPYREVPPCSREMDFPGVFGVKGEDWRRIAASAMSLAPMSLILAGRLCGNAVCSPDMRVQAVLRG